MKYALLKYALLMLLPALLLLAPALPVQAEDKKTPWSFPTVTIEQDEAWPGFYLPDLEGDPLSVQDYRGQKVVLHIFASW